MSPADAMEPLTHRPDLADALEFTTRRHGDRRARAFEIRRHHDDVIEAGRSDRMVGVHRAHPCDRVGRQTVEVPAGTGIESADAPRGQAREFDGRIDGWHDLQRRAVEWEERVVGDDETDRSPEGRIAGDREPLHSGAHVMRHQIGILRKIGGFDRAISDPCWGACRDSPSSGASWPSSSWSSST